MLFRSQGSHREFALGNCLETGAIQTRSSRQSPFVRRIAWSLSRQLVLLDDDTTPDELHSLQTTRDIRMRGYWQSHKYFSPIAEEILSSFRGSEFLSPASHVFIELIEDSHALGLHVRRGDYVTNPRTGAFHGICDLAYYHRAVGRVLASTRIDRIFVFSDDVEWCDEKVKFEVETVIVRSSIPDTDQLKLLASCEHHVIANSSYSWWAAWFGQSESQIVIFPEKWFADGRGVQDPPARWSPM